MEDQQDLVDRLYAVSVEARKYQAEDEEVCIPASERTRSPLMYYLAHIDELPEDGTK